jgi:hypothetical protein
MRHLSKPDIEENKVMLAQYVLRHLRRHGFTHALAGLIVMVAASGLATPAIAQISIGIGMGMGTDMMSQPMPQAASPSAPASSAQHRTRKAKSARTASDTHASAHAKSDSGSHDTEVDETSFPAGKPKSN